MKYAINRKPALRRIASSLFLSGLLSFSAGSNTAYAASVAGSVLGNQATTTYLDENNIERTVTSNLVVTTVQQIAGVQLESDSQRLVSAGGQVSFPHTLTNLGNGPDTFDLLATNEAGDDYDLNNIVIYADQNEDGVPDNAIAITETPSLEPGETFSFVVVAKVSSSETDGTSAQISVSATSAFDASSEDSNLDTATVTSNAVVSLNKAISASSGASGSGPYTYTLTFVNSGNLTATDLLISDVLPEGMTYVANSGRYSATGNVALGDAAGASDDPSGAGITYQANSQVTATIDSLDPGQSGSLSFQVTVDAGLAPGDLDNTASYEYDDGSGALVTNLSSNTVSFTVTEDFAVSMTGENVATASQGDTVSFANVLTNNGNAADTYDIVVDRDGSTFPEGSTYSLYKSDGATPMTDTDGNGIPDTGSVAAGASYTVILKVTLPNDASGDNGGAGYTVQKTANSLGDPTLSATTSDSLDAIAASSVDIMNNEDSPTAPGFGAGPETDSVLATSMNPGTTVRIPLYIKNTSGISDSYRLQVSTDSTFATQTLPEGWSINLVDAEGNPFGSTDVLTADGSELVYADVSVPAGVTPSETSVYFKAYSPNTASSDIVHNSIVINDVRALSLTPNNEGKLYAGGSVVYSHTLTNEGNTAEGNGSLSSISLTSSDSNSSFTSVIYLDANNDGILGAGDPVVTNLDSYGPIEPGDSVRLFVKVFSEIGTAEGASNRTVLEVTTTNGSATSTAPVAVSAEDRSIVVSDQIMLLKEQALDANNDGLPDTAYSVDPITTGAIPGANIIYRITVSNMGTENAFDVHILDTTPSFTTYTTSVSATVTGDGSVKTLESAPADGIAGTLDFNIGTLAPAESATVTFGVRID